MLKLFTIVLIILILSFLLFFKRKYIYNAFSKKNFYGIDDLNYKNKQITPSAKYIHSYYENNFNKYLGFSKKNFKRNYV